MQGMEGLQTAGELLPFLAEKIYNPGWLTDAVPFLRGKLTPMSPGPIGEAFGAEQSRALTALSAPLVARLLKTNPFSKEAAILRSQIADINEQRPFMHQMANILDVVPLGAAAKFIKGLRGGKTAAQPVIAAAQPAIETALARIPTQTGPAVGAAPDLATVVQQNFIRNPGLRGTAPTPRQGPFTGIPAIEGTPIDAIALRSQGTGPIVGTAPDLATTVQQNFMRDPGFRGTFPAPSSRQPIPLTGRTTQRSKKAILADIKKTEKSIDYYDQELGRLSAPGSKSGDYPEVKGFQITQWGRRAARHVELDALYKELALVEGAAPSVPIGVGTTLPSTRLPSATRPTGPYQAPAVSSQQMIRESMQGLGATRRVDPPVGPGPAAIPPDVMPAQLARGPWPNAAWSGAGPLDYGDIMPADPRLPSATRPTSPYVAPRPTTQQGVIEAQQAASGFRRSTVSPTVRASIPMNTARRRGRGPQSAAEAPTVTAPQTASNFLGLRPIVTGLPRVNLVARIVRDRLVQPIKKAVVATKLRGVALAVRTGIPEHMVASPAMAERARAQGVATNQATVFASKAADIVGNAFQTDKKGRIVSLFGIDPELPGSPTIQDVAARLPRFVNDLTEQQKVAMTWLRENISPFQQLLRDAGSEFGTRSDIIEGGFYLPRSSAKPGTAHIWEADTPLSLGGRGRQGLGAKVSAEKGARFDSMSQGVEAGDEYPSLANALHRFAQDSGHRAIDQHVADYFKAVRSESGELLGETLKETMLRQNPQLVEAMERLRHQYARLQGLGVRISDRQDRAITKFLHDPTTSVEEVAEEWLRGGDFSLPKGVAKGELKGKTRDEIRRMAQDVRDQIADIRPLYKSLESSARNPRGRSPIDLANLNGWTFPDEIAVAANKEITRGNLVGDALLVFNNMWRMGHATLDNSAIGIQGLLAAYANPRAAAKALKVSFRVWATDGDRILGRFIQDFDSKTAPLGRLSAEQWGRLNLRLGGIQTEMSGTMFEQIPIVREANRAYGFYGDTLRLGWADDLLETEMKAGRSLDEIISSGDAEKIASISNRMTGWDEKRFAGSVGDLLMFAPRFFQARIMVLARASGSVQGVIPGRRASIDQRVARNALIKMIGTGIVTTVAVNEMLGNETDPRPIIQLKSGKRIWNPNFMRIRALGRDWSLFGTYDSMARTIAAVGLGSPMDAVRGMGSGAVTMAWDLHTGESFKGTKLSEQPLQYAVETLLPFALSEAGPEVSRIAKGVQERDITSIARGVLTIGGELMGAKSSAMTEFEQADELFRSPAFKYLNPGNDTLWNAYGWQIDEVWNRNPALAEKRVGASRGEVGEVVKLYWDINQEFKDKVSKALSNLNEIIDGRLISRSDVLRTYFDAQTTAFNEKRGVDRALKRSFADAETPLEKALDAWHKLSDQAQASSIFDAELLEDLRSQFEDMIKRSSADGPALWEEVLMETNRSAAFLPQKLLIRLPKRTRTRIQRSKDARARWKKRMTEGTIGRP